MYKAPASAAACTDERSMVLLTRLPTKVMVSPRMIDAAITNWLARLKRRKGANTLCHPGRREFDVGV
ncbi:hypothetical protein D9M68_828380 [compost metagenome]